MHGMARQKRTKSKQAARQAGRTLTFGEESQSGGGTAVPQTTGHRPQTPTSEHIIQEGAVDESGRAKRARQDQAGLETAAQDVVVCRMLAQLVAQSGEVAMRTRREGAVQDQTWVTSNPRERQGSRDTQSRLDRGATQRKSPSPVSSSQWPALISVCLWSVRLPVSLSPSLCVVFFF